jgi:hypothetical protein
MEKELEKQVKSVEEKISVSETAYDIPRLEDKNVKNPTQCIK